MKLGQFFKGEEGVSRTKSRSLWLLVRIIFQTGLELSNQLMHLGGGGDRNIGHSDLEFYGYLWTQRLVTVAFFQLQLTSCDLVM